MTWQLPDPLSREVVLSDGGDLVIAGGLGAAGSSTGHVLRVVLANGQLRRTGALHSAVHDAAGMALNGHLFVVGGGAATGSAEVQQLRLAGAGRLVGTLPQARSDLVATSMKGRGYVLGGYDGTTTPRTVLATTDGRTFTVVARLPLSVRYPALAVVNGSLILFGGEHAGRLTSAIQRVDPATGTAAIVGHLPWPLSHAAAADLGGDIVLVGGRTNAGTTARAVLLSPFRWRIVSRARLPYAVSDAGAAVSQGALWLVGGESGARRLTTVLRVTVTT